MQLRVQTGISEQFLTLDSVFQYYYFFFFLLHLLATFLVHIPKYFCNCLSCCRVCESHLFLSHRHQRTVGYVAERVSHTCLNCYFYFLIGDTKRKSIGHVPEYECGVQYGSMLLSLLFPLIFSRAFCLSTHHT